MGFMAGFGTAFARQIEIGQEQRNQQKSDAFKLKYADYINRRDYLQELKREDAKAVKKAQALIERTGADPKTIGWVVEQVKGDADEKSIEAALSTGKFDFTQKGGETQATPIDQQMQDSGMAPAEAPEAPSAPESPQVAGSTELLHSNPKNPATKVKLSDKLHEAAAAMEQRRSQRLDEYATNEVAGTAGVSPEEVQGTIAGDVSLPSEQYSSEGIKFTPAPPTPEADPMASPNESAIELEQAKAAYEANPTEQTKARLDAAVIRDRAVVNRMALEKGMETGTGMVVMIDPVTKVGTTYAAQVNDQGEYIDDQGNVLKGAKPLSPAAQEALLKINSNSSEVPKYLEKTASVTSMLSDFKDANDVVNSDPRILAKGLSGVAQIYSRVANEAKAIAETMAKNGFESGEKAVEDMVNNYGLQVRSDPKNLAAKASLFQALNIKMAYTLSRLEGQTSSGQSNKDVDRFMSMLSEAGDPEAFRNKMSNMIMAQVNELQQQGELLGKYNNDLLTFKSAFGWTLGDTVPNPKEVIEGSTNPKVTGGYDIVKKYADQGNGLINTPEVGTGAKPNVSDANGVPAGIDPEDWKYMDEEDKKLFLNSVPGDPNSPVKG